MVGKPFKKGQSGNPGGRPKAVLEVVSLARAHGKEAINRLAQLMRSDDERVSVSAAQVLLDRGFGKPTQPIAGEDGEPIRTLSEIVIRSINEAGH